MKIKNMNNKETKEHLLKWCDNYSTVSSVFGWPTDACGYEQHIKFVHHRNKNWYNNPQKYHGAEDFVQFVRDYANSLEIE
jgi:hypothetical protein